MFSGADSIACGTACIGTKMCACALQDGPPPPAADDAAAAAALLQEKYNAWQRRVDVLIVQSPQVHAYSGRKGLSCTELFCCLLPPASHDASTRPAYTSWLELRKTGHSSVWTANLASGIARLHVTCTGYVR